MKAMNVLWILTVLTVGIVLCLGGVALADTVKWDGSQDTSWLQNANWDTNDDPDSLDDVTIDDVTSNDTCIFDEPSDLDIRVLTLAGDSPTKMTLNVSESALTVIHQTELEDYSQLDADDDFTSEEDTNLSGEFWIDVANSIVVYLQIRADVIGAGVNTLHLHANTSGVFKADNVYVNTSAVGASTALKLDGTNSTMQVLTLLQLESDQGSNNYKAKLWVAGGMVTVGSDATAGVFELNGGTITRAAEVDMDDSMSTESTLVRSGYADFDVASGKTLYGGQMTFESGSHSRKSGTGTVLSGPP